MKIVEQGEVDTLEEDFVDGLEKVDDETQEPAIVEATTPKAEEAQDGQEVSKREAFCAKAREDHATELERLRLIRRSRTVAYEMADAARKTAKNLLQEIEVQYWALADDGPDYQYKLEGGETESEPDSQPDHDALLDTDIFDVFDWLTKATKEKVQDLGIKTVRDFENLRGGKNPDYPGGIGDVEGWGPVFVDKCEEAIMKHLAKQPVAVPEEPETLGGVSAFGEPVYQDVDDDSVEDDGDVE